MDDVIIIIKPLENSGILTDGVSKTVKHEIKYNKVHFFVGVIRNFRCYNARKYVNWKKCNESWKRSCKSGKRI